MPRKKKEIKYVDKNNREYKLGDIVLNNLFGDYWTVGRYKDNKDISKYEEDCPFYLAQYDDVNSYFIDLDEPEGFEIIKSKEDGGYEELLEEIRQLGKEINKKATKFGDSVYKKQLIQEDNLMVVYNDEKSKKC